MCVSGPLVGAASDGLKKVLKIKRYRVREREEVSE